MFWLTLILLIITLLHLLRKNTNNNFCTLNFENEYPFRYKIAIINNLISRAKLISCTKIIFYKKLLKIKQSFINNKFPNYIADKQIKRAIKNGNPQNKHSDIPPNKHAFFKLFTATRCTTIIT